MLSFVFSKFIANIRIIGTDNIAKIILDSLNDIAFHDDSQIVKLTVIKRWTEGIERVEFILEEVKYEN